MPFLYTAVFSYLKNMLFFLSMGQVLSDTWIVTPVTKPWSLALCLHWVSSGMCQISVGASCALLVLRCLEKRLAMMSWRQGPNSNVLLRFAQLCDPGDNQRVRSHKICICRAEQHLLPLFWIYFNIRRSSTFLYFQIHVCLQLLHFTL